MKYKLHRVGTSLAITIPAFVIKQLGLKDKDYLDLELSGKKIIIKKED